MLALALVGTAAGCTAPLDRDPSAAAGGRACQLIEYDRVEAVLGVRFDTSAGAQVDQTYSCLLGRTGHPFPEVLLTLSQTDADPVIFRAIATPAGFTAVKDLGRSAYQLPVAAGRTTAQDGTRGGPGVRIGWLSVSPVMLVLSYTGPAEAAEDDVAALTPAVVELARGIEQMLASGQILG